MVYYITKTAQTKIGDSANLNLGLRHRYRNQPPEKSESKAPCMSVLEAEQQFGFLLRHPAASDKVFNPVDIGEPLLFRETLDVFIDWKVAFGNIAVRTGYHIIIKTRPPSQRTGDDMVVCRCPRGQGDTAIDAGSTGLITQEIGILERAFLDRLVPDATQGLEFAQKKVLLIQGDSSFAI